VELKLISDHGWHNTHALNILRFSFAGVCLLVFIVTAINLIATRNRENKTKQQLSVADTLINCITLLAEEKDINKAIDSLLKILNNYFDGDRAYLFEFDYEKQVTNNTYEYAAEGITKEIDNLQEVPLEVIDVWIKKFEETGTFYISSLDKDVDKESETYRYLEMQQIESLIAVPLIENNVIIGFLGIDNPKINYEDLTLLSSATFFILDSIDRRETHSKLHRLSFEDTLTSVFNRNKFNNDIEEYQNEPVYNIGIAFFDLNGLKEINDTEGHEAGDRLIKNAANRINSVFVGETYRIGGDEFVVITYPVEKDIFEQRVQYAINKLKENSISVKQVNLLPYHNTGKHKYSKLDRDYAVGELLEKPSAESMELFRNIFVRNGFNNTKIGG
jgi:diguanylate cyclase (GGDEF)-like protein